MQKRDIDIIAPKCWTVIYIYYIDQSLSRFCVGSSYKWLAGKIVVMVSYN